MEFSYELRLEVFSGTTNHGRMTQSIEMIGTEQPLLTDQELDKITQCGKELEYHGWPDEYTAEVTAIS